MLAELFYNPSAAGVYGRYAILASILGFAVVLAWISVLLFKRKPGAKIRLSSRFWAVAASVFGLFVSGYIGMRIDMKRHEDQIRERNRLFRETYRP